ncbi:choline O-acetyltransferase-like [Centruroides vittatus]|uniref:choline O-acetyltransferase-like n=1 Tax=Centruroides vittatus TaxID=120091 RepID=UPI00350EFB95
MISIYTYESLAEEIKNASAVTDTLIDTLELNVFIFKNYGKGFPKKQNISPDVFIQLCLQLTYFRMHNKVTATYESAALRKFRFGRIDNIRASSQEALEFSKSMLDPSLSQTEKWDKFQKAVKKQTEILRYTINGEGPDNHLLCLKEMAAMYGLEEPALYNTDYYKEFLNFRLSTSQLPTIYDIKVGYGPVVPDGYGCSYNPEENRIVFCISSFKNAPSTDTEKFAQNLHASLMELKELCKKKRSRTAFINVQLLTMEREFNSSHYMSKERKRELTEILNLSEQVKVWFQNRRMKYKEQMLRKSTCGETRANSVVSVPTSSTSYSVDTLETMGPS